jgi:hypothetical protein
VTNSTYLKRIQTRLSKRKVKVSYEDIRKVVSEQFSEVDLENLSDRETDLIVEFILTNQQEESQLVVSPQSSDATRAESKDENTSQLAVEAASTVELSALEEAIAIIEEISEDDTSRNQALARQLLEEVDRKTTSIVSLIELMPEIEAEMLRRKLKEVKRNPVNYEGVFKGYFQGSQKLTKDIQGLVARYGVTI